MTRSILRRAFEEGQGTRLLPAVLALALPAAGCDLNTQTNVVLENDYAPSATRALVVYRAYWQAVSFLVPVPPGSSTDPETTVPASPNTAYVILAPGWDPESLTPPTSFVVLQSRSGFGVQFGDTLTIRVDDTRFIGNCASNSFLPQTQADFITGLVFPDAFSLLHYDAATCTTTPVADAGAH